MASRVLTVKLLLLVSLAGAVRAEDWPTWRHDRLRTGVTGERLDPPLSRVWTFRSRQARVAPKPTPSPHQAKYPWLTWHTLPIIAAGDSLFFTSAHDGRVVCLDAATGKPRWEFLAGAAVSRAATFWRGKVYAGSDDGYVYCLAAATGKVVWRFRAAPSGRQFLAYGKPVSAWPVRTGVTVDEGVAYFGAGVFPHDGTFLYALDAATGKVIWRNATQAETGWRAGLAPAGHLLVTGKNIWVPRDCWGYFTNWGSLVSFDRATGRHPVRLGPDADDEWPYQQGHFWPVFGLRKGNVRHFGTRAVKVETQPDGKEKHTELWREDLPGRWVEIDSALSVRYKRPTFFRWDPDLSSVVYAGGVLFHSAYEMDPKKPIVSGLYARDPATGKVLWSAEVAGRANQLIVAGGRLFTATRQGVIHCFARQGAKAHGTVEEPAGADPFGAGGKFAAAARSIVERSDVKAGYAVVLDCRTGELAYELATQTELHVVAVFRDATQAAAARKAYGKAGMHVSRLVAMHVAEGEQLALPSYSADLIVSESAAAGGPLPRWTANLNRMLKPIRGVALIGGRQSAEALGRWIRGSGATDWKVVKGDGQWARRVRPRLAGAGGWYHPYADAGHTNCSNDAALKGPLGVLWYGTPHLGHGSGAPANAWIVDGVLLLPEEDGALAAYDQYTGRPLWRRGHSRTDTVAGPGSVFLRYLELVVRLDPHTGKELHAYRPPDKDAKWHAMAAARDGRTLFLVAGTKDWRALLAVDAATGKVRWQRGGPAQGTRWGGWQAIGEGLIYQLGPAAKGDARRDALAEMRAWLTRHDRDRLAKFETQLDQRDVRMLTALDASSGKTLYERGVDITNCGGAFLPRTNYGTGRYAKHYNPGVGFCMIAPKDVVVLCTQSGADKGWGVWPRGGYKQRGLAVHDGRTGKLLWNRLADYRTRPVVVDETIYAEPWAYDLRTGARKQRVHPITGEQADWAWCRSDKQCGIFSASRHFLFGRSLGVGYHNLRTDSGLYTFFHSRMSCSFDAVSGGGMMIKPPNAVYCKCSWSLPFTVAMGRVPTRPVVGQAFPQPGPSVPVKHLRLDFGAAADRRDKAGNLWIHPNHAPGHHLLLGYGSTTVLYAGGEDVRRSSVYTPVESADAPFVFASATLGVKRCILPVTTRAHGAGVFTVKLGFAALPGDRPGQRVFDVRLRGKTVLKNFDILREAGRADRAVWKEFPIELDGDLVVDFLAKADKPTPEQLPLINGLVLLRKEATTLGLAAATGTWLSRAAREKPVAISLANLRDQAWQGRVTFEAGKHLAVDAPADGAVKLASGARKTLSVRVRARDGIRPGRHVVTVRATGGGVAALRTFVVEWLDTLERVELNGSDHPLMAKDLRESLGRRIKPGTHWQALHVTSGPAGGACTVQVHVPEKYRGRIRAARLRLFAAPALQRARRALASTPAEPDAAPANDRWGRVRQLQGPPWPDLNKVTYPDLPAADAVSAPLQPLDGTARVIEAQIPGDLGHVTKTHHFRLLVEPTSAGGAAYWGHRAAEAAKRPVVLIDYEPIPETK